MEPADSIGRLGFARWYERQLIEGHAWFVSCVLCVIAVAACAEELSYRGAPLRLLAYVLLVFTALKVGIYGMIRYGQIMTFAETLGEHATCRPCGTYARFRMISATQVRCRKCGNEWRLIN
jgi:hypothetical protein